MADYQNRMSQSFSERMRLNRFRRKRERSSFAEEFRVVPRWLVVTVLALYVLAIVIGTFVNLGHSFVIYSSPGQEVVDAHHQIWPPEFRNQPVIASLLLAGVLTLMAIPLGGFLLFLGYVYRDAKRRGMHAGLWLTLILILSPAYLAIGFLLYFFLREPLPYPCPQCGTTVGPRFNYCPNCDNNLHPACPHCRQEVSEADKFCPNCGNTLSRGGVGAPVVASGGA
jgi:ABC-type Fe3+ transport system permease subunit/RNA polymerase subunit RPABC4/transcription elongation factor Spt4